MRIRSVTKGISKRVRDAVGVLLSVDKLRRYRMMRRYTAGTATLYGKPFDFVDGPTYVAMHREIVDREMYKFKCDTDQPYIVDCGANIGVSCVYFKTIYPRCEIIALEADARIAQVARRNCELQGYADVQVIPAAAWTTDGFVQFEPEGSDAGRVDRSAPAPRGNPVECRRLKDLLNRHVDLLKMDIEGAETDVLQDCADQLRNVDRLFVEYHSFSKEDQKLHLLLTLLAEAGFRVYLEPATIVDSQPLFHRTEHLGMDMQINIFATRTEGKHTA